MLAGKEHIQKVWSAFNQRKWDYAMGKAMKKEYADRWIQINNWSTNKYSDACTKQLQSMRVFVSEVPKDLISDEVSEKRFRYRMEAALIKRIDPKKKDIDPQKPWEKLADSGMKRNDRRKDELPILARNIINKNIKIYGLCESEFSEFAI